MPKPIILTDAARLMRAVNSEKQQAAARENGRKGGRPRKHCKYCGAKIEMPAPGTETTCKCGAKVSHIGWAYSWTK